VIKGLVKGKDGKVLIDQIRSFDKQRLLRKIGETTKLEMEIIKEKLKEIFKLE
jgi:mRNA-degrading endonuclease toxin of MazEF toxin-antitoxin module